LKINRRERRYMGFQVLTAVVINVTIFWDIASQSLYVKYVSEECITPFLGPKMSRTRRQRAAGGKADSAKATLTDDQISYIQL
jgi:hypothetical protein